MTEESSEKEAIKPKPSSLSDLSIPMGASIEDIRRAVKILGDNGGQARMSKIGTSFGTKPSEKNLFGWALNAAVAFGLVLPHKRNAPYVLSEDGTRFTSLTEDEQKTMMLGKLLKFEGYKTILVAMKNNQDKTLKKQTITEMWLQIRSNTKLGTRQLYTTTFASVGAWCGALEEIGQSCLLKPEAETVLEPILRGGGQVSVQIPPAGTSSAGPSIVSGGAALLVTDCPHCGKTDISIENEELLQTLSSDGIHTLIIRNTYYCRGCSRTFSRIDQRVVKIGD